MSSERLKFQESSPKAAQLSIQSPARSRRLSTTQIDCVAGIIGGATANGVAHPLDTVKTRIQLMANNNYKTMHLVKSIYAKEGVSPLTPGPGILQGNQLPDHRQIASFSHVSYFYSDNSSLSKQPGADSNLWSWAPIKLICSRGLPQECKLLNCRTYSHCVIAIELMKLRAQTTHTHVMSYSKELQTILAKEGPYGLTRGLSGQLLRDAPGFSIYFSSYHFLKNALY